MTNTQEILVSYAWGGESESTVDEVDQAFATRGLKIVRDKKDLSYKGSIEAFEQRIGRGKAVIVVISDKYLRSKHCMSELVVAAENKDLRARIFPVVLADAKIYDQVERLDYIQYWDEKIAELNQAMKAVEVMSNLKGITNDLDLYDEIRDNIAELTDLLSDMNTLTPEIHAARGYTTLIAAVLAEIEAPTATQESETMADKKSNPQSEPINTGGGAYVGGNINTGGGDFVGRDKSVTTSGGGIAIGGNVTDSTLITGNNNVVNSSDTQQTDLRQEIYTAIEQNPQLPDYAKDDLTAKVKDLEGEDAQGDQANAGKIEYILKAMAPDILEVALATIANPVAGFGVIAKKVAEKIKAGAS
jgi:hypothetical protein